MQLVKGSCKTTYNWVALVCIQLEVEEANEEEATRHRLWSRGMNEGGTEREEERARGRERVRARVGEREREKGR